MDTVRHHVVWELYSPASFGEGGPDRGTAESGFHLRTLTDSAASLEAAHSPTIPCLILCVTVHDTAGRQEQPRELWKETVITEIHVH